MSISQVGNSAAQAYEAKAAQKAPKKQSLAVKNSEYGAAIGDVKLSDKAASYYEDLKSRFGDMNFILVSEDTKDAAEAMSSAYASKDKLTVLIDVDKIEEMANDETVRNKYEGLLTNAKAQMSGLADSLGKVSNDVLGYGMKINDDGTATYFAVLKDMSAKAKEIREEKIAEHREAKKASEKAAKKAEQEEKSEEAAEEVYTGPTVTVSANSLEELLKKVEDYAYSAMSDNVLTEQEKYVGQNFDFRG